MQTQPTVRLTDLAKTYGGRDSGGRKRRGAHGSRPAAWLPGDYFITADNEDRAIGPPALVKTKGGRDHRRFRSPGLPASLRFSLPRLGYSGLRGHVFKINKQFTKTSKYKRFFSNRVVTKWNSLPHEVVNAKNLNEFKNKFDNLNKDIIYSTEINYFD